MADDLQRRLEAALQPTLESVCRDQWYQDPAGTMANYPLVKIAESDWTAAMASNRRYRNRYGEPAPKRQQLLTHYFARRQPMGQQLITQYFARRQ